MKINQEIFDYVIQTISEALLFKTMHPWRLQVDAITKPTQDKNECDTTYERQSDK